MTRFVIPELVVLRHLETAPRPCSDTVPTRVSSVGCGVTEEGLAELRPHRLQRLCSVLCPFCHRHAAERGSGTQRCRFEEASKG